MADLQAAAILLGVVLLLSILVVPAFAQWRRR
jgi:hypothetical protein